MNRDYIVRLFPAFLQIQSEELRSKSIEAMALAMERGGWTEESIERCPVTVNWENCEVSWIEHVNDVTDLCLLEFDRLNKYYLRNGAAFDRDTVAAGALLHDIGKLTEYELYEDELRCRPGAELLRHPVSGAIIAASAGLPDEIIHIISTHSFEGDNSYRTAESDFVRSIDDFVFKNTVIGLEKRK